MKLRTAGAGTLQNFALYTLCGTFLYAVCAGFRDNYGIMLPYIVEWSGIPYSTLSFVIALGQLFFGLMQPVFGLLALRTSARAVLWTGSLMMLAGLLLIPLSASAPLLTLALGILLPSGTAAASFGIIMSCISPPLPTSGAHFIRLCRFGHRHRHLRPFSGDPVYHRRSWPDRCDLVSDDAGAAAHSRVGGDNQPLPEKKRAGISTGAGKSATDLFREAFRSSTYRRLGFGFFTCGFHMALIQTHLFSQLTAFGVSEKAASYALSVYGIGAIAGAVGSGAASARFAYPAS